MPTRVATNNNSVQSQCMCTEAELTTTRRAGMRVLAPIVAGMAVIGDGSPEASLPVCCLPLHD